MRRSTRNFAVELNKNAANDQLPQLVQGISQGVSTDQPGSAYTRCFPDLCVSTPENPFDTPMPKNPLEK